MYVVANGQLKLTVSIPSSGEKTESISFKLGLGVAEAYQRKNQTYTYTLRYGTDESRTADEAPGIYGPGKASGNYPLDYPWATEYGDLFAGNQIGNKFEWNSGKNGDYTPAPANPNGQGAILFPYQLTEEFVNDYTAGKIIINNRVSTDGEFISSISFVARFIISSNAKPGTYHFRIVHWNTRSNNSPDGPDDIPVDRGIITLELVTGSVTNRTNTGSPIRTATGGTGTIGGTGTTTSGTQTNEYRGYGSPVGGTAKLATIMTRNSRSATVSGAITDDKAGKFVHSATLIRLLDNNYFSRKLLGDFLFNKLGQKPDSVDYLFGNFFNGQSADMDFLEAYISGLFYYASNEGRDLDFQYSIDEDIVITFDEPVGNFYIDVQTILSTNSPLYDYYNSSNVLGTISVFDSSNIEIKTATPVRRQSVVANTGDYFNEDSTTRKASFKFSIVRDRKEIKKVVLKLKNGYPVIYSGIDFDIPQSTNTNQTLQELLKQLQSGGLGAGVGSGTGQYGYYYNSVTPNPHIHYIKPNPHAHDITPNPHRHAMKFFESGSIDGRPRVFDDGCKLPCNVLIEMIYKELNTELAGSKSRVTEAAKKGNWITANKLGKPICEYLENYFLYRVICYLRSRVWYTEYESLAIVPTELTIEPTGLILSNSGNNIVGPIGTQSNSDNQGTSTPNMLQEGVDFIRCIPPDGECTSYPLTPEQVGIFSCDNLGLLPGQYTPC